MKCVKGTCPETSNDPKITVSIIDQENGSIWGYYCNYDCASKDMATALEHMLGGGEMATIPDPQVEVETPVNVANNENADAAPDAVVDTTNWHKHHTYAEALANTLIKNLNCPSTSSVITDGNGISSKVYVLGYGNKCQISIKNDNVFVDLGDDNYDSLINPDVFKINDAIAFLSEHIPAVKDQQTITANTSPF